MKLLLFGILLAICGVVLNDTLGPADGGFSLFALLLACAGLVAGVMGLFEKDR